MQKTTRYDDPTFVDSDDDDDLKFFIRSSTGMQRLSRIKVMQTVDSHVFDEILQS